MLIPMPQRLVRRPGSFTVTMGTGIRAGHGTERAALLLRRYLADALGLAPPVAPHGDITLTLDSRLVGLGEEGHSLIVSPQSIVLRAGRHAGLLHGVQSLRQLLQGNQVPAVDITDQPRFPWRGALLDVARHFMPIGFLRRFVDLLALHKLNVLHLHLTDDQGWRMPVPRYPRLTEVGGWRAESMVGPAGSVAFDGIPHGGAYTRAELRSLVSYAAERGVTVMPEIEMPGHARAALAAYPSLGNFPARRLGVWTSWGVSDVVFGVQESTLDFCREVLAEVMDIFPSRRVHIGGDECPTIEWRASDLARRTVEREGLAGPEELRGWFLGQVSRFLVQQGREPVCWDDGERGAGLPAEATVMAWRDAEHGVAAARRGHRVVMTPWRSTYFDYPQSAEGEPMGQPAGIVTLEDVYRQKMMPGVLGTQGQVWTEFARTPEEVEYLAFPRLCALAERAWSSGEPDWAGFLGRIEVHERRLKGLGVNFRPV
jgi:hexosaminidase